MQLWTGGQRGVISFFHKLRKIGYKEIATKSGDVFWKESSFWHRHTPLHVSEGQQWPQDEHEDCLGVRVTVRGCLGCNLHENLYGYRHNDPLTSWSSRMLQFATTKVPTCPGDEYKSPQSSPLVYYFIISYSLAHWNIWIRIVCRTLCFASTSDSALFGTPEFI